MLRPKHPKPKSVMLINDVPVAKEVILRESGEEDWLFSAASNTNLITALKTGRVNQYCLTPPTNHKGIPTLDIYCTYLDYTIFGDGQIDDNFDYKQEVKRGKEVKILTYNDTNYFVGLNTETLTASSIQKDTFIKLEAHKDVYVSYRLHTQIIELVEEIKKVNPSLIIVTGKWGLFFLAACTSIVNTMGTSKDRKPLGGITTYRASILQPHSSHGLHTCILYPMHHTLNAIGMPAKAPIFEYDLQKAGWVYHNIKEHGLDYYLKPPKTVILGTTVQIVQEYIGSLLTRLDNGPRFISIDIETLHKSVIDCIGITDSISEGICIPLATVDNPNYWSLEDEVKVTCFIREVLLHKNCLHIGQNYTYDCQYFYKKYLLDVKAYHDTAALHHILFNFLPKNLAFLASLYCEYYTYWKDDITATKDAPETRWTYNVKDVMYTLEVLHVLLDMIKTKGDKLNKLYRFVMDEQTPETVITMNTGVLIDKTLKAEYFSLFNTMMMDIESKINKVLGFDFNLNSSQQKQKLFSEFFGIILKTKKKTGNATCDAAAMLDYIEEYPLYRSFLTLLLEHASLKVFVKNFLGMQLDDDNRARTQYHVSKTATGRLASTKNVWGNGGNFQNIPSKGKINLHYAVEAMEGDIEDVQDDDYLSDLVVEGNIILPNVKRIFIPDPGMEMMDADLSGADAFTYFLDSECKNGIDFLLNPKDKLAAWAASHHLQREITENDTEYRAYKASHHGWWYGMEISKLALTVGCSYDKAKELDTFYSYFYPERDKWHDRLVREVAKRGYITNSFGRVFWFLNTTDPTLKNKMFAAIPQSTTAEVINRGWINIRRTIKDVKVLLQVHDSLVMQYPIAKALEYREQIKKQMEVFLDYKPSLAIPVDFKVSTSSYGECEKIKKQK